MRYTKNQIKLYNDYIDDMMQTEYISNKDILDIRDFYVAIQQGELVYNNLSSCQ